MFLSAIHFNRFFFVSCRLHYWEEALLPRDPRRWRAWALLFVLVHVWWVNAPYLSGWVKHNLCCSNGQLRWVMAGYWTCSGHFFLPMGCSELFEICRSSSFDTFCIFSSGTFKISVSWISDSSLTMRYLLYIFLYVFNLWRKKAL